MSHAPKNLLPDPEIRPTSRYERSGVKKGTYQEFGNKKMIIANSGPIISFARADYLYLLRATVKEIIIPNAVFDDIVVKGRGKPGAEEVKEAVWIKRKEVNE